MTSMTYFIFICLLLRSTLVTAECISGYFSCHRDCCQRTVQFCHDREERCRNCEDRKPLCGNDTMPLACDAFCLKLQTSTSINAKNGKHPLENIALSTGLIVTLSVVFTAFVFTVLIAYLWHRRSLTRQVLREDELEAKLLESPGVPYKNNDDMCNLPVDATHSASNIVLFLTGSNKTLDLSSPSTTNVFSTPTREDEVADVESLNLTRQGENGGSSENASEAGISEVKETRTLANSSNVQSDQILETEGSIGNGKTIPDNSTNALDRPNPLVAGDRNAASNVATNTSACTENQHTPNYFCNKPGSDQNVDESKCMYHGNYDEPHQKSSRTLANSETKATGARDCKQSHSAMSEKCGMSSSCSNLKGIPATTEEKIKNKMVITTGVKNPIKNATDHRLE